MISSQESLILQVIKFQSICERQKCSI